MEGQGFPLTAGAASSSHRSSPSGTCPFPSEVQAPAGVEVTFPGREFAVLLPEAITLTFPPVNRAELEGRQPRTLSPGAPGELRSEDDEERRTLTRPLSLPPGGSRFNVVGISRAAPVPCSTGVEQRPGEGGARMNASTTILATVNALRAPMPVG